MGNSHNYTRGKEQNARPLSELLRESNAGRPRRNPYPRGVGRRRGLSFATRRTSAASSPRSATRRTGARQSAGTAKTARSTTGASQAPVTGRIARELPSSALHVNVGLHLQHDEALRRRRAPGRTRGSCGSARRRALRATSKPTRAATAFLCQRKVLGVIRLSLDLCSFQQALIVMSLGRNKGARSRLAKQIKTNVNSPSASQVASSDERAAHLPSTGPMHIRHIKRHCRRRHPPVRDAPRYKGERSRARPDVTHHARFGVEENGAMRVPNSPRSRTASRASRSGANLNSAPASAARACTRPRAAAPGPRRSNPAPLEHSARRPRRGTGSAPRAPTPP